MKHIGLLSTGLLLTATLAACTKPSPSDFMPGFGGSSNEQKVAGGPNLDGGWTSDCLANPLSYDGTRRLTMTFAGNAIDSEENDYSDSTCTHAIAQETYQKHKGTFFFKSQADDVYVMQYMIPLSANASQELFQKVQLKGDVLNVTDIAGDDSDLTAAPSIALHRGAAAGNGSGGSTPAPTPKPTPAPSSPLSSGYYTEPSNAECPQTVATQTQDGVLSELYVTLESPCSGTTLSFECYGGSCVNEDHDYRIRPVSSRSYVFTDDSGATYTFSR